MTVKLLTEHHLEFLGLTGGCTGSSESTLVKMPHCWKSHVTAQIMIFFSLACIHKQSENSACFYALNQHCFQTYMSSGEFNWVIKFR